MPSMRENVLREGRGDTKRAESEVPPARERVVGVTRFELVTSSVSGKRSPPELNALM